MLVMRWQAPLVPTPDQVKMIFLAEGLEPQEEAYPANGMVKEHRHPLDEVRMVVSGEMLLNVSGNQVLLRAGDRVEIPSNTKHETTARGTTDCMCIFAHRAPL